MRSKTFLFLSILLAACGYDMASTGLGDGALPGDPLYFEPGQNSAEQLPGDSLLIDQEALVGRVFRMETLVMDSPLSGALAQGLNQYFSKGFLDGSLNIVLVVEDFQQGSMMLRIAPVIMEKQGWFFEDEGGILACHLDGAGFITHTASSLDFPNEMLSPPVIPLQNLKLSGFFDSYAKRVLGGTLEGALAQQDAEKIKLMGIPLATLLNSLNSPLTQDLSQDGQPDAWLFLGVFSASIMDGEGSLP